MFPAHVHALLRSTVFAWVFVSACVLAVPNISAAQPRLERVTKWARYETSFRSSTAYNEPLSCVVRAELVSPIGETNIIECFWDGGRTWNLRFRPDLPGIWRYGTTCSDPSNTGLHQRKGAFLCTAVVSDQRFTRFGPVRRTPRGKTLQHRDGTPFLWLADLSETGIRQASLEDWDFYSQIRARQGFTAIQWTLTGEPDERGETVFADRAEQIPNPRFFRRLDKMIEASDRLGLLSAIALPADAFRDRRSTAAIQRYVVARWNAYNVAWIIKSIPENSSMFGQTPLNPVLLDTEDLPTDVPDWVSGLVLRTDSPALLALHLHQLRLPIVLLLTNRENSVSPTTNRRITADEVRREAWWNTVQFCAAGFSYSAAGVVDWNETTDPGEELALWHKSLFLPGAKQLASAADFLNSLPREKIDPIDPRDRLIPSVAAAQTDRNDAGLFYAADGQMIELPLKLLPDLPVLTWFNPRTRLKHHAVAVVGPTTVKFWPPSKEDWLLLIEAK